MNSSTPTDNSKTAKPTTSACEVWLRTNRRALGLFLILLLGLALAGLSGIAIAEMYGLGTWMHMLSIATIFASLLLAAMVAYQMTLPRLAYEQGNLLVYLQSAEPLQIPVEAVELFFLGHGASLVPDTHDRPSKSRTVVIRLAEAATQWHDLPIRTAFGESRESYLIVRGTWCEPLTVDLLQSLNRRLAEAHRTKRAAEEATNA